MIFNKQPLVVSITSNFKSDQTVKKYIYELESHAVGVRRRRPKMIGVNQCENFFFIIKYLVSNVLQQYYHVAISTIQI